MSRKRLTFNEWIMFGLGILWGMLIMLGITMLMEWREQRTSQWGDAVRYIRIMNPDLPPVVLAEDFDRTTFWVTVEESYFVPKEEPCEP